MEQENSIMYYPDTDSYMVFYNGEAKNALVFIEEYGFIDAEVLHDEWYAYGYRIYMLSYNWRYSLKNYGYFTIEFVGFPYHVIPKEKQTSEQYFFIKRLFDD